MRNTPHWLNPGIVYSICRMNPAMTPDIYQFDDFRAFLRECFEAKVRAEGKYSQRQFAREAGFSNPGYYNDVLKGFKPLSENAVEKMARVFGLKSNETEFLK